MMSSVSPSAGVRPVPAAAPAHHVEVTRRVSSPEWAWIEDLHDDDPHFQQRPFLPSQLQRSADVKAAFATDAPNSAEVLLHYAGDPPPGVQRHPVPVVLIHGANADADFFSDPMENGSVEGLATRLRGEGYAVYAVTFADNQDDNYVWAQQLANAIQRVKDLTGAPQVDLVGHSKGCVPERMYLSNFRQPWMTPYRGDVRRAVFEASPFDGVDYLFRHPVANYALFGQTKDFRLNSPMSWDSIMVDGLMLDATDQGFGTEGPDYWPGQRQLLSHLDQVAPLAVMEPDWYTTYYGGRGFVSHSQGIDHFIDESGHFMDRLEQTPIDPKVQVAVLAGDRPNVQGILNEYTGPSDGLLLLHSALDVPKGANVVAEKVMHLNHLQLEMNPDAQQWTADVLGADQPATLSTEAVKGIQSQALEEAAAWLKEHPPVRPGDATVRPFALTSDSGLLSDAPRASIRPGSI